MMEVNGEVNEMTSTGDYVGLNLDKPLYLGGAPSDVLSDYNGFKNSFQGMLSRSPSPTCSFVIS